MQFIQILDAAVAPTDTVENSPNWNALLGACWVIPCRAFTYHYLARLSLDTRSL